MIKGGLASCKHLTESDAESRLRFSRAAVYSNHGNLAAWDALCATLVPTLGVHDFVCLDQEFSSLIGTLRLGAWHGRSYYFQEWSCHSAHG